MCRIGTSNFFFWDQEIFAFSKSSSHHPSSWVPTSSPKVFFQETPAWYWTLSACQNEYLPQVSWWVEGCQVQEKTAEQPATHSVRTCGWHCHAQRRTSDFKSQASRRVSPQYTHLLPWEQQGIHCTHCCSPPNHWSEGAAQEVQDSCQGCCKAVWGVEESPRSGGFSVWTNVDVTAHKVEIKQIQQMPQEAQKAHNKAIAKTYKQLRNLLSGDAQFQWDCICRKMHERDLGAAVNGQVTKGRRPQMWMPFLDCLELHKLTVFSADTA